MFTVVLKKFIIFNLGGFFLAVGLFGFGSSFSEQQLWQKTSELARSAVSAVSTVSVAIAETETSTPAIITETDNTTPAPVTETDTPAPAPVIVLNNKLPSSPGVETIQNPIKITFEKKNFIGWEYYWCNLTPRYWGVEISPSDGHTDGWIFSDIPIIENATTLSATVKLPADIEFSEIVIFYSEVPVPLEDCVKTGCPRIYRKLCALNPPLQRNNRIFTVKD